LGFWGMDNLIITLLKASNSPLTLKGRPRSNSLKTDSVVELEHRHKKFHSKKIGDCHYEGNFHGISQNTSLKDALLAFAFGVQRIAVFDNSERKGPVRNIISQSRLLSFIAEDTSTRLGTLENTPAASLGIPWERVIKAKATTKTIDVVQMMHDKGVWGIPIIDDEENVVSHVSFTDFKIIHQERDFGLLLEPVLDYIKYSRTLHASSRPWDYIVHAKSDALMKDVVKILVQEHVHQLYMFDIDNEKPKSLISLTNICHKVFYHHHPGGER